MLRLCNISEVKENSIGLSGGLVTLVNLAASIHSSTRMTELRNTPPMSSLHHESLPQPCTPSLYLLCSPSPYESHVIHEDLNSMASEVLSVGQLILIHLEGLWGSVHLESHVLSVLWVAATPRHPLPWSILCLTERTKEIITMIIK